MRARWWATVTVVAVLATGCSGDDETAAPEPAGNPAPEVTTTAAFEASGSINAAYVLDAPEGAEVILADADGNEAGRAMVDALGAAMFYEVEPGAGYTVRHVDGDVVAGSEPFTVLTPDDPPDPSVYEQPLAPGLNYVSMRDGVELAMTVRLPTGASIDDGPFPTVIEYSGYQVAAPKDLLTDIAARRGNSELPTDPLVPSTSTVVGSLITPVLGFATVSVQMRGTGCSGGAFDLFDYPTIYDGYDAIETVAAQDWVKGNKVGMVGISFSAMTQMFTGGTRPPHLAAVAPLSVTDDLYRNVGSPGGIFNNGFAKSWLEDRTEDAKPAPEGGQPWAKELVKQGDEHCIANQKLHGQARDVFAILSENPDRVPALYDHREPARWGADIDVPIFISSAFQDEQIIGVGPQLVEGLADNPNAYVTLMNGTHVDPLGPGTISRWAEFLGLYVADEIITIPDTVLTLGSALYQEVAGAAAAPIAQSRFAGQTDLDAAKAEYRKDPRVRVLMDVGGGAAGPGALEFVWELGFHAWPPATAHATAFYLGPDGTLTTAAPTGDGDDSYIADPEARPETSLPKGDAWDAQPPYEWEPVADSNGLGYVSDVLTDDLVVAGPASLDLFLASSASDTDLQVTLSEVRPDGDESYVQFGVLRASYRALDARSTDLEAIPTYTTEDRADLPPGEFTEVRVPIYPVAYAFRAGSRIRITIQAPGGERPVWKFETDEDGTTENTIARSAAMPSKLMLPVLPGQTADAPRPACGAPRGMPCRRYAAAANRG